MAAVQVAAEQQPRPYSRPALTEDEVRALPVLRFWRGASACRDMPWEQFIPESARKPSKMVLAERAEALAVCLDCPVRYDCLVTGLGYDHRPVGIWGGFFFPGADTGGSAGRARQKLAERRAREWLAAVVDDSDLTGG